MREVDSRLAEETVAIRTRVEQSRSHRPLNAPLYQTSQWEAESLGSLADLFAQDPDRGFYARFGHPTLRLAEEKLATLEAGEDALVFGSGMGAITTSLLAVLETGDHVVAHHAIFGQTIQFLEYLRETFDLSITFVDATDPSAVEDAIRPASRLLYLETPSNPIIDVLDVERLSGVADGHGVMVFVDSTFAGPLIQRPLELGADLSLQSASKSLAGHADLLAGSAAGSSELISRIRKMRALMGPSSTLTLAGCCSGGSRRWRSASELSPRRRSSWRGCLRQVPRWTSSATPIWRAIPGTPSPGGR